MVSGRWTREEHGVFLQVRAPALIPSVHPALSGGALAFFAHTWLFAGNEGISEKLVANSGNDTDTDRHSNTHTRSEMLARM
jgi:hypothetical protein